MLSPSLVKQLNDDITHQWKLYDAANRMNAEYASKFAIIAKIRDLENKLRALWTQQHGELN